ncbi:formin-like protein [Actinidia rufa]|uniref:Formin-like protein n=1 Tax=Actinidia rufa TaxID=165716 RepID=A0A7J0GHB2_9ERIC|nr:formin-like protein [Actinidia rufa]
MDPCPFVRLTVSNLALKIPVASKPARSVVHPSSSPCFCKIKLKSFPVQTVVVSYIPPESQLPEQAQAPTASFSSEQVAVPLDLAGTEARACVFHNGWISVGKDAKASSAQFHVSVKAEPDPRFVFQFDGEPECSPQVFQIQGNIRQPVFTCKFSFRSNADRNQRSRSVSQSPIMIRVNTFSNASTLNPSFPSNFPGKQTRPQAVDALTMSKFKHLNFQRQKVRWELSLQSEQGSSRGWLSSFGSERERPGKERKGWSIMVHDLSGSPVAAASMVTPFVASPGSDRVSRSNPGSWLILALATAPGSPGAASRHGASAAPPTASATASSSSPTTPPPASSSPNPPSVQPKVGSSSSTSAPPPPPPTTTTGEDDPSQFNVTRFKPTVEVSVQHVTCTEDAAAFVALSAAVDLSIDACRLFSQKLRKELCQTQDFLN